MLLIVSQFTSYCAFSATAILYFYVIQGSSCPDLCREHLEAALRCQDQISSIAEKNSLVARYCLLLDELKYEALRRIRSPSSKTSEYNTTNSPPDFPNATFESPPGFSDFGDSNNLAPEFNSTLEELNGWAQFESMVSTEEH